MSENNWFKKNVKNQELVDFVVNVKLQLSKTYIVEQSFEPDVSIDPNLIIEQLHEYPSAYSFWSTLVSEQKYLTNQVERLMTLRGIAVSTEERRKASENGYKLAKHEIDDLIQSDEEYNKLWDRFNKETRNLSKLFGIIKSIEMKGESLRVLAWNKRKEYENTRDQ